MGEVDTVWTTTEFLSSLATESTTRNYKSGLKKFFSFIYDEEFPKRGYEERLSELSYTYFSVPRSYVKDYVLYHNHIKKLNYAPKTLVNVMLPVRGLFEFNQIEIPKAVRIRLNGRKAVVAVSVEKVPSREEMKLIIQYLPIHMRCFVLFLLSGGFRANEALQLTLDNLVDEGDLIRVNLSRHTTKDGRKRFTYITPEARDVLDAWLEGRERFIQKNAGMISSHTMREKYQTNNARKVFPFSYNNCNKIWKNALKKAGLLEFDKETHRVTMRLHNLRKYFSTRGNWSNGDIPDFFQGHIKGVRAIYARFDQAEDRVKEAYLHTVSSLQVMDYTDTSKIEELKNELDLEQKRTQEIDLKFNYVIGKNMEQDAKMNKIVEAYETMMRRADIVANGGGVYVTNEMIRQIVAEQVEASLATLG